MVNVPPQYQMYITEAAQGTGLPESVIANQVNTESGFNPGAISPTNAEGFWQFEPTTYNAYAGAAGVPANSEFNVADETKVYIAFMNDLLREEGGNVFNALAAYNAGPGDLPAGYGYASGILQASGQSSSLNVTPATTAGFNPSSLIPPGFFGLLPPIPQIGGNSSSNPLSSITNSIFGGLGQYLLKSIGVPDMKDLLQRLGLIILGAALVLVGLGVLVKGPIITVAKDAEKAAPEAAVLA